MFSQNFTANQPDNQKTGVTKTFAATDDTYVLLASSRGLEMYAWRLDPGNHCNLLQFFDLGHDGQLTLRERPDAASHFKAAMTNNPRAIASIAERFRALRGARPPASRPSAPTSRRAASNRNSRSTRNALESSPAKPTPRHRSGPRYRLRRRPRSATRSSCPDMTRSTTAAIRACVT